MQLIAAISGLTASPFERWTDKLGKLDIALSYMTYVLAAPSNNDAFNENEFQHVRNVNSKKTSFELFKVLIFTSQFNVVKITARIDAMIY